jgi:hypothetical protein
MKNLRLLSSCYLTSKDRNMEQTIAIAAIILALALHYWVGRRRFNRRGVGGLQHFRNYERAVFITILERLITWAANILLVVGAVLLLFKHI